MQSPAWQPNLCMACCWFLWFASMVIHDTECPYCQTLLRPGVPCLSLMITISFVYATDLFFRPLTPLWQVVPCSIIPCLVNLLTVCHSHHTTRFIANIATVTHTDFKLQRHPVAFIRLLSCCSTVAVVWWKQQDVVEIFAMKLHQTN